MLARAQLGPGPDRALEVEQVVDENRFAAADARNTLAQKKPVAAEASAFGDDHAFRAALRNLDFGSDRVGLVEDARSGAGRHAGQLTRIIEGRLPCRKARARCIPSQERRVVERQHVVLLRLDIEEGLHFLDLFRHLRGKVIELSRVFLDVIEFPLVSRDHIRRGRAAQVAPATRRFLSPTHLGLMRCVSCIAFPPEPPATLHRSAPPSTPVGRRRASRFFCT